ncbi:TIGR02302 family protein [Roseomonas sp. BN140053]|uniref:TIGR02302 family protein n=1 Tax=Roseomonas sp. BN140053 TaxID=3391898 RepID=UPI0039EA8AF0
MNDLPEGVFRGLGRQRRLARGALFWEALWPRAWPVLGVAGLFVLAALSGVFLHLPAWGHSALLAGFAAALGAALWRAGRGFAAPGAAAADRRIEQASGLKHRPLATLADRPSGSDPATLALWRAHLARQAAKLRNLRVGGPRPGLPARDPRALRLGLVVALVAAVCVAGGEAGERLRRAFTPAVAAPPAVPGLRLEAWVTPPAYTGAAPVFLSAAGGNVSVPAGSALRLAVSGGTGGVPELVLAGAATPLQALDGPPATSFSAERPLDSGGRLALRRDGRDIAVWSLSVQADAPPTISFSEPPGPAPRGLTTRLPWRAEDDWGIAAAQAELRLDARPGAAPVTVELPLPAGAARNPRGTAQPDLSAHPWAGLPVQARLAARDGAGQEGTSDTVVFTLPERPFEHPVARALVAIRKALSLNPAGRDAAREQLGIIADAPDAFENHTATFLALRVARARLRRDDRPEAVGEVQEILWDVALALEEGRVDRTARALAEARQALREALENRDPERSAEERRAEIDRRIQELREAVRQHMEALADRLQRENAEAMPSDPSQRLMDRRDLERRTERMREAAREGRDEDAQRELAELEEMLKALEEGRVARAENNQRQRQQGRERGQQQMGALQDMVRRESELLDRSHQRADAEGQRQAQERRPFPNRRPPNPSQGGPPPQQGQGEQDRQQAERDGQADARTQRALRRALGELMQQFGDLTGEVPEQLGRADQAMREGAEALAQGGDARPHQERALRELAEGGRQMAQSMQRQFGQRGQQGEQGEDGDEDGDGTPDTAQGGQQGGQGQDEATQLGQGRDPLGRRTQEATGSAEEGGDTRVPDEAEVLRTRRIQEELRRRVGERERPPQELDYLDRLLKRF